MSSISGRDAMYANACFQRSGVFASAALSTRSVSGPIAYERVQKRQ
jgi:hypothetical protein